MQQVVFRVDASVEIGTGHLMRCLTLALALRQQGTNCTFICRDWPGDFANLLRAQKFTCISLPAPSQAAPPGDLAHSRWLGVSQETDWLQVQTHWPDDTVDFLILDHYGLDARWEHSMRAYARKLMVIDDLADRSHQCDILLDQTFGRSQEDYQGLVNADTRLLCGATYALLRPEFAQQRAASLLVRQNRKPHRLLVSLGGVDKDNATALVLNTLAGCVLPAQMQIDVVMGSRAPWLENVRRIAATLPWPTRVRTDVADMAGLMRDADLAIGAAGATSWERCCLGLPSILVVIAENQSTGAQMLDAAGAARSISALSQVATKLPALLADLLAHQGALQGLSQQAAAVTDGRGAERVLAAMTAVAA